MSTERNNIPLNDERLEDVNGGYNVLDGLRRIGRSVSDSSAKGGALTKGTIGVASAGTVVGAFVGAFSGITNEVGLGVNEAVGGIKHLMR